jgi:hypothetical protein
VATLRKPWQQRRSSALWSDRRVFTSLPQALAANEAYVLAAVSQMVAADLARFKDLMEAR